MPGTSWPFADDLKLVLQAAVGVVQDWCHAHMMSLSIEKSLILHFGANKVCHVYMLEG